MMHGDVHVTIEKTGMTMQKQYFVINEDMTELWVSNLHVILSPSSA